MTLDGGGWPAPLSSCETDTPPHNIPPGVELPEVGRPPPQETISLAKGVGYEARFAETVFTVQTFSGRGRTPFPDTEPWEMAVPRASSMA
ncbi:MAG: hypothetical protein HQL37_10060 [Alphaproteobacteria bacterium]|nr:hypothetical protein [Alphaproteobacteria bacterium]